MLVAPDSGPDEFLRSALEALDLPLLTLADPDYYERLAASALVPGGPIDGVPSISGWDLVIFDRVVPRSLPPIPSISVGAGLPIPGLRVEPAASTENSAPVARFTSWRRTHPVMRYVTLDDLVVAPPLRLTLPDSPALRSDVLAWGDSYAGDPADAHPDAAGPLIAVVEPTGGGKQSRRLILAFELAQTNWGPEFSFPVFISNAVEYLSGKGGGLAARSFLTTQPISLLAAPGAASLQLRGPENLSVPVPRPDPASASIGAGGVETSIGVLQRAGVYTVEGVPTASLDASIAVNLTDAWESRIGVDDSLNIPSAAPAAGGPSDVKGSLEIWRPFIAAAALLLLIEWLVFARQMRGG